MFIVWKLKLKKKREKNCLTPKRAFLSFEIKTEKKCSSYFSFVLALKTLDAQMLFWSVFLKTQKKTLLTAKNGQNGVFDSQ